ncbi:MAG: hypothetical protein A3K10_10105 [Bacteroidetes bacterium RIFCSPLOWO2_12_FULL_31_6]|nr:MAG: hypothetical protein A3K10_10105 [Bacteroidetes bacterium RIFCSPLOWO2_12_FULL_31_6]
MFNILLRKTKLLLLILLFYCREIHSQDQDSSKFIIGIKGLNEMTGATALVPDKQKVYNYGLLTIYRLGKSKSSIESGVYLIKRKIGIGDYSFNFVHFPIKYKINFYIFYFSGGLYLDRYFGHNNNKFDSETNYGFALSLWLEKNIYKRVGILLELESTSNLTGQEKFANYGIALGIKYALK